MLAALALVVVTLLSGANVALAQTATPMPATGPLAVVTTGRLNVRSGPGPGYAIVGIVSQNDEVILLGRTTNNSWVMIALDDGTEGWVSTYYVDTEVPISSLPALAVADPWAIVTTPLLNVRSGPGSTYSVLTTIPKGRVVTLIGRTANRAFAEILTDGIDGWVSTLHIKANSAISTLPVTWIDTPTPTYVFSTPMATLTPVPTTVATTAAGATPIATQVTGPGPAATITTGRLNVRTGPGQGYGIVATISQWDTVFLLGRTGDLSWVDIQTEAGDEGWISSRYIRATVPISSLPVLAQASPWAIVTTGLLNVRSGPDSSFDVVTTVPKGRIITLLGRTANNSWVFIVTDGIEGWATTLHLKASAPISTLPIEE
jgi:N-acetylmuramoyl-L-alanine amidase